MTAYIVTLHEGVDYDAFWSELESETVGHQHVPSRAVDVVHDQPYLVRNCMYELTDAEAEQLRNDPRVADVEDPSIYNAIPHQVQHSNFSKLTTPGLYASQNVNDFDATGNYANWGLIRVNSPTNNYGNAAAISDCYRYTLDGTGVDVIIVDTGIQEDHPEFQDASGVSRVKKIDWYATAPALTKPAGYDANTAYTDVLGHGTHVASIAVGKTFGWAKNANIYALKDSDIILDVAERNSGLSFRTGNVASAIIGFHNNKQSDPITGQKRPTVVNLSIGFENHGASAAIPQPQANIMYRGAMTTMTSYGANISLVNLSSLDVANNVEGIPEMVATHSLTSGYANVGLVSSNVQVVSNSINSYVDQMIDAGIHVCISAGNNSTKIDVPGGVDYDNNIKLESYFYFYNRGTSPFSLRAIRVGATDQTTQIGQDQKTVFSNYGPGVDVYSPGVGIVGATSQTNVYNSELYSVWPYSGNTSYKQFAASGTSMSCPQVTGVAALFLQMNPNLTPAQLKAMIVNHAQDTIYTTGNINNYGDYTNYRSVCSPTAKMLYNPFHLDEHQLASGGVTFTSIKPI